MGSRARFRFLAITLLLSQAMSSAADVYRSGGANKSVNFTDAPTAPGFEVVIQETPPVLPWRQVVEREAERYGLDPRLVRAVIYVESAEDPVAVSAKGAKGLMQLMPGTAEEVGVTNPLRPRENIRGGVGYLATLIHEFDGELALALAAYNAGPGAVRKYGGVPPYPETRAYVRKVLDVYQRQGGHIGLDSPVPVMDNPTSTERE